MSVFRFIDKKQDIKTPLLIKIVVILQMWILFSGISKTLEKGFTFPELPALLPSILQLILLIAIWNMRKWAVIAFIVLAIFGILLAIPVIGFHAKVIIIAVIFRSIVLIPALIYWKKMS